MLKDKSQDDYISTFAIALMSMLIDSEVNVGERCSQAVLKISGL